MNITLKRLSHSLYGVFGDLLDESSVVICWTLEHAFPVGNDYKPKIPAGVYTCKRGEHRLHNLIPFSTFEVMGVPDFDGSPVSGILFHKGNTNNDSEGCILLGESSGTWCILDSKDAFDRFMEIQQGIDEFQLTVLSESAP